MYEKLTSISRIAGLFVASILQPGHPSLSISLPLFREFEAEIPTRHLAVFSWKSYTHVPSMEVLGKKTAWGERGEGKLERRLGKRIRELYSTNNRERNQLKEAGR